MCSSTDSRVNSRVCDMCKRRFYRATIRTLCEWVYRVNVDEEVFEYRAFNMNVCQSCWFNHSVYITGGFYECVKGVEL